MEVLRVERIAREQAEANVAEQQVAAEIALKAATSAPAQRYNGVNSARRGGDEFSNVSARSGGGGTARRSGSRERGSLRRESQDAAISRTRSQERFLRDQANAAAASQSGLGGRSQGGKDDIDARLNDFLDRSGCQLSFRRRNKGWYSFRVEGERQDRSVEVSITNGKLMAKVEPSTHDPGWNNGKLGPIERFVAHFSSA